MTTTNILGGTRKCDHRFNLAVIGCGDIAISRHLPALIRNERVRIAMVCDRDPERAAAAAAQFQARHWTGDHREVLACLDVEAVIVATPPWATPALVIEALEADKDVLCEKPLAVSLAEARRVRDAEKRTGRLVQVGFTYRHGLIMETMRRWIEEDRLGRPLICRIAAFDEIWNPEGNPEHYSRLMTALEHGPPCLHDGAHSADHLHFLTGSRAARIQAYGVRSREEFPAANYNVAHIAFENGDRATLEIGWFFPHLPEGHFEILGPKGMIRFDHTKSMAELLSSETTERVKIAGNWFEDCFREQLENFLRALETRQTPVPGTAEGIASLELTKAIEESMACE